MLKLFGLWRAQTSQKQQTDNYTYNSSNLGMAKAKSTWAEISQVMAFAGRSLAWAASREQEESVFVSD